MDDSTPNTPSTRRKLPSIRAIARHDKKFLSKYAALFATVTGFLAITSSFGALGYKISVENRQNSQLLNAVGLEKTLSQQVSKDILTLQKEWKDSQKFNTQSFASLGAAQRGFDDLLRALRQGGNVQFGSQNYTLDALDASYAKELDKIETSWSPLRSQIGIMSKAYKDYAEARGKLTEREKFLASRKTFTLEVQAGKDKVFPNEFVGSTQKFAALKASTNSDDALGAEVTKTSNTYALYAADLLTSVEKLNDGINANIGTRDASNTQIQLLMSALSLLLFFVLTFYFIRKNIISDFVIFSEDREKKGILDNINEGLFLMNTQWTIQSEGSKFLHTLFNRHVAEGTSFRTLLSDSVDAETMANAERFVNILVTKNIKGSMVDSLNPLKLIALNLKDSMGDDIVKHVSVHFGQIHDANGQLQSLLVGVVDSTEKQKLAASLKEEIKKNKETFALLIQIGKSEHRDDIKDLLIALRAYLDDINDKLKDGAIKTRDYSETLRELKNHIHGFKNDAGLLGVDILQKLLHDFEDQLIKLHKSGNISAESFLNLPYQFKEILEAADVIDLLVANEATPQPLHAQGDGDGSALLNGSKDLAWIRKSLDLAISQTAKNFNKSARVDASDFFLPHTALTAHAETIRAALVHMAKNSVAHGIEEPATRVAMGKPEEGLVTVRSFASAQHFDIHVSDDGAGLDIAQIRRKISELGLADQPIDSYSDHEAIQFIFHHGFSTAAKVTLDAGRGVGLDQVKLSIERIGGSVSVSNHPGQGAEFILHLPSAS